MKYVLVIEDSQGDIDLLLEATSLLGREGKDEIRIIPVLNGVGALNAVDTHNPSLILMDINLPGRSGLNIVRDLRKKGYLRPIIMMSSSYSSDDIKAAYEAGANTYFSKPYEITNLMEVLDKVYQYWDIARIPDYV